MSGFFGKFLRRLAKDGPQTSAPPNVAQQPQQPQQTAPRPNRNSTSDSGCDSDGHLVAPIMVSPSQQGNPGRGRRKAFSRQTSRLSDSSARAPGAAPDPAELLNSLCHKLAESRRSNSVDARILDSLSSQDNISGVAEEPISRSYRMLQPFHTGRYCKVLSGVERRTSSPVIIKMFPKSALSASVREMMLGEIDILRRAQDCPGVVKLKGVVEDTDNHYTVLEKCDGRTLIELMVSCGGRMSERRCAIEIGAPLVQAVAQLHELGVVHRNLKPEHLVCSAAGIKLLDLFEAGDTNAVCLNHRTGVKEYMAPEVLDKPRAEDIFHQVLFNGMDEEELPQYDAKADVWSIGVLVYEALSGCQPFQGETLPEVMESQRRQLQQAAPPAASSRDASSSGREGAEDGQGSAGSLGGAPSAAGFVPGFIARLKLSPGAEDFLIQALQMDPAKRASAADLAKHQWLTPGYHRYSTTLLSEVQSRGASRSNSFRNAPDARREVSRNTSFLDAMADANAPAPA